MLVTGSRTQALGAGSMLHSSWVRGIKTISDGSPVGIDLKALRKALMKAQPNYRNTHINNPKTDDKRTAAAEDEYRAAMGLDVCHRHQSRKEQQQQQQGDGEGESSPPATSALDKSPSTDNKDVKVSSPETFHQNRVLYDSTITW